jgi:hypothetical protein
MDVQLSDVQVDALRTLLDEALGDLSTEIADTENPKFRASLDRRRSSLRELRELLGSA